MLLLRPHWPGRNRGLILWSEIPNQRPLPRGRVALGLLNSGQAAADAAGLEDSAPRVSAGLIFEVTSNHFQGKIDLSLIAFPPANVINN